MKPSKDASSVFKSRKELQSCPEWDNITKMCYHLLELTVSSHVGEPLSGAASTVINVDEQSSGDHVFKYVPEVPGGCGPVSR